MKTGELLLGGWGSLTGAIEGERAEGVAGAFGGLEVDVFLQWLDRFLGSWWEAETGDTRRPSLADSLAGGSGVHRLDGMMG